MNRILYLLIMLCLVIVSCDDEHNDIPPEESVATPFWEHSHLSFTGLNGPVKRLVETTSILSEKVDGEQENRMSLEVRFNSGGQMTYYNPIGEVGETRGSVWQSLAYYSYRYDEKGRMVEAVVTELGGEPIVYTLQYGEHDCYVPLIFPLGNMDFFLIKGLRSINSADGTVSYVFNGGNAAYRTTLWTGDIETKYTYEKGNPYPMRRVVTTSRNNTIVETETTVYSYLSDGELSAEDICKVQEGVEAQRTVIRYQAKQFCLPISKKIDMGTFIYDWLYQYDEENHLKSIEYIENKGSEDEMSQKEEYTYLSFDSYGNWTVSQQVQNSFVDWSHGDGVMSVRREILY